MRLPDAAFTRTTRQTREQQRLNEQWPVQAELLAQVIEEVSVLASDHRRKKPREVPRPEAGKHRAVAAAAEPAAPAGDVAPAVAAMKSAARTVHRRVA